jgi:hypothetical protein
MNSPPKWSLQDLQRDAREAKAIFRRERLDEPREQYSKFFHAFVPVFGALIDRLADVSDADPTALAEIVRDKNRRTGFRYLAGPPISEDDLKTLAETTLSATALRRNPEEARRVRDVVLHVIDPNRFPWVAGNRPANDHERERAIVASAAMVAANRAATARRGSAKQLQESRVKEKLRQIGLVEVLRRNIPLLDAAPAPGEFCPESRLGDTRADLVVRLYDRRVLAIECKVSNSAVNSFKRLNHEAAGKARSWLRDFGERQVVPSAILSGVFSTANLQSAQAAGLNLFWAYRLDDLESFIAATR